MHLLCGVDRGLPDRLTFAACAPIEGIDPYPTWLSSVYRIGKAEGGSRANPSHLFHQVAIGAIRSTGAPYDCCEEELAAFGIFEGIQCEIPGLQAPGGSFCIQ